MDLYNFYSNSLDSCVCSMIHQFRIVTLMNSNVEIISPSFCSHLEVTTSQRQPKMKVLQATKRCFAAIGITRNLSVQSYPVNRKVLIGFLTLLMTCICSFAFTFYKAETFAEYTQSVYIGAMAALINFYLINAAVNVKRLLKLFDDLTKIANTSNCFCMQRCFLCLIKNTKILSALKCSATGPIFTEFEQLERKSSEIIFLGMAEISPAIIIAPFCFYTYFTYFTTDLGADAFHLPFPMW